MYTPSLIRIIYSNVQIVHTERLTYRQTDRQAGRQTDRQKERKVNHFPCPASGLVPLWNLWSSSKYSVNPFAAPACKSSGLKEPRTCLRNSIFSGPITHLLSVLSVFHVPVRKRRQTGLRVLNFAVVFVVSSDTTAVKGLSTPAQTFHAAALTDGHSQVDAVRLRCPPQTKSELTILMNH